MSYKKRFKFKRENHASGILYKVFYLLHGEHVYVGDVIKYNEGRDRGKWVAFYDRMGKRSAISMLYRGYLEIIFYTTRFEAAKELAIIGITRIKALRQIEKKKKFYRTVISIEVLSEKPYDFNSLEDTCYDIMDGECSGKIKVVSKEEVYEEKMKKLLIAQGSDPDFFMLDGEE